MQATFDKVRFVEQHAAYPTYAAQRCAGTGSNQNFGHVEYSQVAGTYCKGVRHHLKGGYALIPVVPGTCDKRLARSERQAAHAVRPAQAAGLGLGLNAGTQHLCQSEPTYKPV
jgi:hypothetical protein